MPQSGAYLAPDIPETVSDGLAQLHTLRPPLGGVLDGYDPATLEYPPGFAPVLENIRVSQGVWQTRLGQVLVNTIPGSGNVRLLDNLYQSGGLITRLAARGSGAAAQLYALRVGTDAAYTAATGGGSLGGTSQPYFQGVTLGDLYYFTDRQNGLFKYNPNPSSGNQVLSVTQPAAPTAAPGATPRPFALLDDWTNGWNDSDATKFADSDDSTNQPAPGGGKTRKLAVLNTGAKGQTITRPTGWTPLFAGDVGLGSHAVAFWLRQDQFKTMLQFQMGLTSPNDYTETLAADTENTNTWYPFFLNIGDLATANYIRFLCLDVSSGGSANVWVSSLYLPGTLEGPYRWVYTYYDSTGQRESAPSPITNSGNALDFSSVGVSFQPNTTRAFTKCCALSFTSSGGAVNKIRVYRNGGVPSLTTDANGTSLWLRVAELPDYSTTFSQTDNAGASLLHLTSVPSTLAKGMWLVLEKGVVGKEEYVQITGISTGTPGTVNIARGLGAVGTTQYTHASGAAVQIAFVDNTPNETIQLTQTVDIERGNPPAAAKYVQRSPDGRLWLFNYSGTPTGISVSNRATPDRPTDYECFPSTFSTPPDPETRASLLQGWGFQILGNLAADEAIEWGGFFQGWAIVLTRGALYSVAAQSQAEWGPTSVQRLHEVGCLAGAGDTVRELDGWLYWVAPGPRVMRWDGSGEPENLSHRRINVRLQNAPAAQWGQWFAQVQARQDGRYYMVYFVPSGQTQPTQRLDYNIDNEAWEPVVYYDVNANPIALQAAAVQVGLTDTNVFLQADTVGNVWQAETGSMDGSAGIKITFATPKIPLFRTHQWWQRFVDTSLVQQIVFRNPSASDTVTLQASTGGGEYPDVSHSYSLSLASTSADVEVKQRLDRDLLGRWCQFTITGTVVNRPAFRTVAFAYIPLRPLRVSG